MSPDRKAKLDYLDLKDQARVDFGDQHARDERGRAGFTKYMRPELR